MGQIINASIDLSKIDKSRIQKTDKDGKPYKNGQQFYNISIFINDTPDKYGNNVSIQEAQTQAEREAKVERRYLGNGKVVWGAVKQEPIRQEPIKQQTQSQTNSEDDLPF